MKSELFDRALRAHQAGRFAEAEIACTDALGRQPEHADGWNLLGVLQCQSGRLGLGLESIRRALALRRTPGAYLNLALALAKLDRPEEALAACRDALGLRADFAEAYFQAGALLKALGRHDEAVKALQAGLAIKRDSPQAFCEIGGVFEELNRRDEAIAAYRVAAEIDPNFAYAHCRIGVLLHDAGREGEGQAAFRRALALKPDSFEFRWRLCVSQLRLSYASIAELETARAAYERDLRGVVAAIETMAPARRAQTAEVVGHTQPFHLPYQGRDDRALQTLYGAAVCRLMAARHPQFARDLPMPPRAADGRIRLGIVSGFFCRHSNWKIPIKGWVDNLDKSRFELYLYHLGGRRDQETESARRQCAKFVMGHAKVEAWAQAIRADDPHVLIFPETGMDRMSMKLAALRLAPAQAASWGHPNTSGLPTMDYFLSSALMEAPEADAYYTEKLVRLPNLSIHYRPPAVPELDLPRERLGLRAGATVYWCCQSLFKYLPQHDEVFAQIARQVGDAQFVFIQYEHGARVAETFKERLLQAFLRHGLSARDHCLFLPHMDASRFNAVAKVSDVFLDSIEWSACNSLLECLQHDLPPVTFAGRFMRGRHGAAILTMMGLTEMIASNLADYVAIAARLGRDARWRQEVRARIARDKHRLWDDAAAVRGLEFFLDDVVDRHAAPPATMQ